LYCTIGVDQTMRQRRTAILIVAVFLVGLMIGLFIRASPSSTPTPATSTVTTTIQTQVTAASARTVQSQDILSVCFSPGGGCADVVVYWIGRANSSIHILIYSFTLDSIGNALITAKQNKPGLDIRIVWDASASSEAGSEYQKLLNAGFNIHVDHRSGLLHDKVAIIDSHIILTGSFNWSNAANHTNGENLIVIDNPSWASAYEQNFQENWSATAS
jgi:phospholipase D